MDFNNEILKELFDKVERFIKYRHKDNYYDLTSLSIDCDGTLVAECKCLGVLIYYNINLSDLNKSSEVLENAYYEEVRKNKEIEEYRKKSKEHSELIEYERLKKKFG